MYVHMYKVPKSSPEHTSSMYVTETVRQYVRRTLIWQNANVRKYLYLRILDRDTITWQGRLSVQILLIIQVVTFLSYTQYFCTKNSLNPEPYLKNGWWFARLKFSEPKFRKNAIFHPKQQIFYIKNILGSAVKWWENKRKSKEPGFTPHPWQS
jgi:hypothetical protein